MTSALRLAVAAVIVLLLARTAPIAWRNRALAVRVWRRIRPRHVVGSVVLLAVVLGVAVGLMILIPVTGYGLGSFIGLTGNAVFAPVEEAAARGAAVAGPSSDWIARLTTAGIVGFLVMLLALFPWLAYVEELVFREGMERFGTLRRLWTALRFGLVHLVMLVPVAAAIAISVAGLWYGSVYLRAFGTAGGDPAEPAAARAEAVLAATVWHTTFNSMIVLAALGGMALGWL